MRLGHATVRYNAKMSIGNTKQQPPRARQPPAANKSDINARKIEFYLFTPAGHGMASFRWICASFIQIYFTLSLIHSSFSLSLLVR